MRRTERVLLYIVALAMAFFLGVITQSTVEGRRLQNGSLVVDENGNGVIGVLITKPEDAIRCKALIETGFDRRIAEIVAEMP